MKKIQDLNFKIQCFIIFFHNFQGRQCMNIGKVTVP